MTILPVRSTYRLQLRGDGFTLADARETAKYLQQLGVSHVYLSPVLTAMRGSSHGYDVADPTTVNPELGGPAALRALADELRERGMGIVVDIVPNHVGVADPRQNRWWWHVLQHGRDSEYADWFDIDWGKDNGAGGRIALPVLRSDTDPATLTVDRSGDEPMLAFGDLRFPIAEGTDNENDNPLRIHDRQHYRLVSWESGVATYRRFFAVNDLAAVRQEHPDVFAATHAELAAWCAHDLIDGVRVDHPDGLADPSGYLRRLRELIGPRLLLIEKVLGDREPLDCTLPIQGTTGYDALAGYGGVFVDPAGEAALTDLSHQMTGGSGDASWLREAEQRAKRVVAQTILAPEVRRLVTAIRAESDGGPDLAAIATATIELLAAVPVYRTDYAPLTELLGVLIADLERATPALAEPLSAVVQALAGGREAATRFNQVCGAVTAKAVEDSVYYRAARLVSLQEVGGDPGRFGYSLNEFHQANAVRARYWPATMTTLSTHDTKRGEDVRARIGVLSQIAERWSDLVLAWHMRTPCPDPATGLFLLQNMVGVWPASGDPCPALRERLHAYAEKAVRESGARTSWDRVDNDFEWSLHEWIDAVLDGPVGAAIGDLVSELAPHGWSDALAQKLLQLTGPGIPDVYQGTEVWADSLVDPDNRRPVDFAAHEQLLSTLEEPPGLDGTGAAKLWVTAHALWLRRERPDSFVGGSYRPVYAAGEQAGRVVAFARGRVDAAPDVITAVARFTVGLTESGWGDTTLDLPEGTWTDRLSSRRFTGTVRADELLAGIPAALLVR